MYRNQKQNKPGNGRAARSVRADEVLAWAWFVFELVKWLSSRFE